MTLMTPDRRPVVILSAELRPVRGRAGLRSNEWHGVLSWKDPAEEGRPYDGQPVQMTNPLLVIADNGVDEILRACQATTLPDYVPDLPVSSSEEEFKRLADGPAPMLHQAVILADGRRGLVIDVHPTGLVDVMLETGDLAERVQVREVVNDERPKNDDESPLEGPEESEKGDNESKNGGEESTIKTEAEHLGTERQPRRVRQRKGAA